MTNRLWAQLTIIAMFASWATVAAAQDDGEAASDVQNHHGKGMHHDGMGRGRGDGFRDPGRMVEMMQRHLDLDETQTQQLNNIVDAAKPEIEAAKTAFRENREAMRSLETSDPDYSIKLQNLSGANAELAAKVTLLHGSIRADIHAVLTPEQVQMLEERGQRFRDRENRHRRHGHDEEKQESM